MLGHTIEQWLTVAERAYGAYAKSTGGKTYDGRNMPVWSELPDRIQEAWKQAVVMAVMAEDELR